MNNQNNQNTSIITTNEKAIKFANTYKNALDVQQVTDSQKAVRYAGLLGGINSFNLLASCRFLYIVRKEKLYKDLEYTDKKGLKKGYSFETFCETFVKNQEGNGISRATANDYARVGEYINESGTADNLPKIDDFEKAMSFTYSQIREMLNASGGNMDLVKDLISDGKIRRVDGLSVKDIRKIIKPQDEKKADEKKPDNTKDDETKDETKDLETPLNETPLKERVDVLTGKSWLKKILEIVDYIDESKIQVQVKHKITKELASLFDEMNAFINPPQDESQGESQDESQDETQG